MTAARATVVPLRAPVTATYVVPRVRLQRRLRRVTRSPFAADLRRAWARVSARRATEDRSPIRSSYLAAFWPAVVCAGLVVGLLFATRGHYISWDGVQSIPTGGAR